MEYFVIIGTCDNYTGIQEAFLMGKFVSMAEAVDLIQEETTIMFGGFMGCGSAHSFIDALARKGTGNLTIISNDASSPVAPDGSDYYGVAKLIHNRQVKKLYTTHVGLNPEVSEQMKAGILDVVLIPQGSMAEMIRAGGAGLGGILTPTGLGTSVEESEHVHSVIEIDGKKYLLERPMRADVSVICGHKIDRAGNIWYKGTTRNFNQIMAMASDMVIAEAEYIVDVGKIEPENVMTPGILVDYVVKGGNLDG